jgi:ribonuclease P protein component
LFAIKSIVNPRRKKYRVAVVVSKKVSKSAVRRNRIRRRLYEAVRALDDKIIQPYDIVITVFHDSVVEEPYESLQNHLKKQLQTARITK